MMISCFLYGLSLTLSSNALSDIYKSFMKLGGLAICTGSCHPHNLCWEIEEKFHMKTFHQIEDSLPRMVRIPIPYEECILRLQRQVDHILSLILSRNMDELIEVQTTNEDEPQEELTRRK